MDEHDNDPFPLRHDPQGGENTATLDPLPQQDEPDELVAPGDIYAATCGPRLSLAIEYISKAGRSFTVPYSYLPLLWWEPPGSLIIEYPGFFSVLLQGKELDEGASPTKVRKLSQESAQVLVGTHFQEVRSSRIHEAGRASDLGG